VAVAEWLRLRGAGLAERVMSSRELAEARRGM
jgi:hypothetical protein